jgi:hypothetical protein
MPTYESVAAFQRQWSKLDAAQRAAFKHALAVFIANLRASEDALKVGGSFSPELRVHELANTEIWSLTFARDGRALFRYGEEVTRGERHIVWEAIGDHDEVYNFKK